MKSVVAVAHPDDDALWFGGLVLNDPGDWTIICYSIPQADPIRAYKFFDACQVLGAVGRILPFAEPAASEPLEADRMALVDLSGYDRIVTHGAEGGYGHNHHASLSAFIHNLYPDKLIWSDCPQGKSDYRLRLELSQRVLARKLAAVRCYDHVLPYEGVPMTKAAALEKRYWVGMGLDPAIEQYRIREPINRP